MALVVIDAFVVDEAYHIEVKFIFCTKEGGLSGKKLPNQTKFSGDIDVNG